MSEETRAAMTKAVDAHLRDEASMPQDEELGDLIVVAAGVSIDREYRPCARYYLGFKEPAMLPHVAIGLLTKGLEVLDINQEDPDE